MTCGTCSSFPALLHFAYKYADSPERAILANANAGGENVARGSLVGALLGAAHGIDAFPGDPPCTAINIYTPCIYH